MELKQYISKFGVLLVTLLIAPLMELKLFTNASPLFCFPLLIAPLMELKQWYGFRYSSAAFIF